MRVDIWSDIACPFCYIAKHRLEQTAQKHNLNLQLVWHAYELYPNAPQQHSAPHDEVIGKPKGLNKQQGVQLQEYVANMAKPLGIQFNWQQAKVGNTFNIHRLSKLAEQYNLANQLEERFFKAFMTDGLPIGDPTIQKQLAVEVGLPLNEVENLLNSDQYAKEVRGDEVLAQQMGITGVPFFVFNNSVTVSGAQSEDVFLKAIQQAQDNSRLNSSHNGKKTTNNAPICTEDGCEIPPKL